MRPSPRLLVGLPLVVAIAVPASASAATFAPTAYPAPGEMSTRVGIASKGRAITIDATRRERGNGTITVACATTTPDADGSTRHVAITTRITRSVRVRIPKRYDLCSVSTTVRTARKVQQTEPAGVVALSAPGLDRAYERGFAILASLVERLARPGKDGAVMPRADIAATAGRFRILGAQQTGVVLNAPGGDVASGSVGTFVSGTTYSVVGVEPSGRRVHVDRDTATGETSTNILEALADVVGGD